MANSTDTKKAKPKPKPIAKKAAAKAADVAPRKRATGRPSKYRPEFCLAVEAMARLGWIEAVMAERLGVSVATFSLWKLQYPLFLEALKIGKEEPDDQVERSLFERATGYQHKVVKPMTVSDGKDCGSHVELIEYIEHIAPDVTAMIYWLKNRRPARWRDRIEVEPPQDSKIEVVITDRRARDGDK